MYAEERQREIAQRIRSEGRVDVATLSSLFDVTPETVRRDLTALERRGLLRRVHGGAMAPDRLPFEPALAARAERMAAEKERIAKAALDEIPDSGSVFLDAGSTTEQLAAIFPEDREVTVLTHSLTVGMQLMSRGGVSVHLLGGRVRPTTLAAVGGETIQALSRLLVDVAFVGTNGLSVDHGLTTPDPDEAAVKRAIVAAARRVVVLADHTKVGNDTLVRFGDLVDVEVVVTDSGLATDVADRLESAGPQVVRA